MFKNEKILVFLMVFISIFFIAVPTFADDEDEEDLNEIELQELVVESSSSSTDEPNLNARSAIIYDRTSKQVIWGKNENTKRAMASTTKIMSAIVVLENSNLTDTVTVSQKAANTGGSRLKIKVGDKISVNNLLYGLMLRSRK